MRRRKLRRSEDYEPEVELPITPMLDMAFQLLMFFVMTYHPSNLEGQFAIELTATEQQGGSVVEEIDPQSSPSPLWTDALPFVTVTAHAGADGDLQRIEIRTLGGGSQIIEKASDSTEMVTRLQDRLLEIKQDQEKLGLGEERIVLRAAHRLRWKETMSVLDGCRQSEDGQPLFPHIELDELGAGD